MNKNKIFLTYAVFILIVSFFSGVYADDYFGNKVFAGSNKYPISDRIAGSNFTANGTGVCWRITAYLETDGNYDGYGKYAIYYASNWTKLGETASTVLAKGQKFWLSMLLVSEVNVVEGTKYYLCAWAELDVTKRAYLHYNTTDNEHMIDFETYNGYPVTLTPTIYGSNNFTIYAECNYTEEWINTCPSSSSESPTNNTAGIDIDSDWSISITDIDGNTTDGQLWCQQTDTYYNWTGLSNGTKTLVLPTLDCLTQYKIYCNYSDENCNKYEWYFFTTEFDPSCNTCSSSSSESPTNNTAGIDIDSDWSISITDIDGNTTDGQLWCQQTDTYYNWTGLSNGTKTLVLPTLEYNTLHKVYCNYSDENCNKYEWYFFTTESEIWENTCPVSSGLTIANKTENVSINTWWNVTITDIDGNTTNGSINCSSGNTTSWSNQANGTRSLELNGLSYSTNYTIWLNYSDEHCNKYEWYWFITEEQPEEPSYNLSDYMNRTELNETFLGAFLNLEDELYVILISLGLLFLGIIKKDSIIGFLCCYSASFLLLMSWVGGLIINISGIVIVILIFIGLAIGTYKVFLAKSESENK